MNDPLDLIEEGCYLALRLGLEPSAYPVNCLEIKDGVYSLRVHTRAYHPLEVALIGDEARCGDWMKDAATKFAVPLSWVVGFLDGFALGNERPEGEDYVQGYLAAEDLRARRFRWLQ